MNACYYDIESLQNVFTLCNFHELENTLDIYVLSDTAAFMQAPTLQQDVENAVHEANKNFTGPVRIFNLSNLDAKRHMARTFGLSDSKNVNDPTEKDGYLNKYRLVCDTDKEYQENEDAYPYLFGYNSYNYDTTMLAVYLTETFIPKGKNVSDTVNTPNISKENCSIDNHVTAAKMRRHNDMLFSDRYKKAMPSYLACMHKEPSAAKIDPDYKNVAWRVRKNMLMSGRHLDVARLNEKQQHVALKRLLGMLGYQILESDKLSGLDITIDNYDQFLELLAYNASDVINLANLFKQKIYKSTFELKKGLLKSYPDLIYKQKIGLYEPWIDPAQVRRDRLTIDSSSAQFATKALCPYGHLKDIPAVSFEYPSETISKERGIPRRNILEETRNFFFNRFPQPELRREFDRIYNYYKSIEGRNFNLSENYQEDYGEDKDAASYVPPESITSIPDTNTCLFYYNQDGTPSSCFVTFSTGGIHGAEYNKALYEYDLAAYNKLVGLFDRVKAMYPDPVDLKRAKSVEIDGVSYPASTFLTAKSTLKHAEYKSLEGQAPEVFKTDSKGGTKLNKKYTFTSSDPTNHEDFTSYYPNLLIAMSAFYNDGLGYDRYNEIFENKQKFGKLMKDKSLSEDERQSYSVQREGTKLVLNSASGAGDADFESNIRMNNQIISMRIIGQLFSYTIGQAQTLAGARITSTNTDGLYSVLEPELNNRILAQESANISVAIEPEPLFLISKDSNNRIEMDPNTGTILNASGGSLACRDRPNPTKSLAHPAIIDWALSEYLVVSALHHKGLSLSGKFDDTIGMSILKAASKTFSDDVHFLLMFQNVVSSSTGSVSYIFGTKDNQEEPIILQHYNRTFIMKDNTPGTMHLQIANARVIPPPTIRKRKQNDEMPRQPDPLAMEVLEKNGVPLKDIPDNKEPIIKKINGIEPGWSMLIENHDLYLLPKEQIEFIKDNLDYDKYLGLLRESFDKNWRNKTPELDRKKAGRAKNNDPIEDQDEDE